VEPIAFVCLSFIPLDHFTLALNAVTKGAAILDARDRMIGSVSLAGFEFFLPNIRRAPLLK